MKTLINLTGVSAALLFLGLLLADVPSPAPAMAGTTGAGAHAGHAHDKEHDELDRMFENHAPKLGEHAGCDHGSEHDELDRMFEEDAHPVDPHAGHGHEEHSPDGQTPTGHADAPHAGHNHGSLQGICSEHGVLEAECALCQGSHLGDLTPGQGMKVRLASEQVAARAGVRTALPQRQTMADGVELPGRVIYNRERAARLSTMAPGVVREVHVLPGAAVTKGTALVTVAIPEVATLKAELLASQARLHQDQSAYQREADLLERGISSRREFQQAEAAYRASRSATERYRQQLLNFGMSEDSVKQLTEFRGTDASVTLRAPFSGTVTELQAAIGESVNVESVLVTVADLDPLWVELSIPEVRIYQAEAGASIEASFDGLPGQLFTGRLFQVGAALDERTRSLKALAEVRNPGNRLKVGMFGSVRILSGEAGTQLVVPTGAVQNIDGQPYLFLGESPDLFELRRVATGATRDGMVAITGGLASGDRVVVEQGFALKSEVLKARLGASCADH